MSSKTVIDSFFRGKRSCYITGEKAAWGNRIGYCWNPTHRGYLNKRLAKEHQCRERKCRHLEKFNSSYWEE